jgi:DNA-binding CsgD family transcriptional regulator
MRATRGTAYGVATRALVVLIVAAIGLLFVAELWAPPDVPLGAAVVVPVLLSCFFLDQRWSVAILVLAVLSRVGAATIGDTSAGLAALEVASYIGAFAIALAYTRRTWYGGERSESDQAPPPTAVRNVDLSPASPAGSGLTDRERQVLDMAMHGLTAKQIGERLYIGRRTVETHLARAYGKLGGPTKSELIARAFDDTLRPSSPSVSDQPR